MTDRRNRDLTDAELRQRTEAGRKSHEESTMPTGVLNFAVGHYSAPGAQDGDVKFLYRTGSALVARLNARPPAMVPTKQPVQSMTAAQEARRGRG